MESSRQSRATLVIFTSDNGADLNARERAGEAGVPNPLALPQASEAGNLSMADLAPIEHWWPAKLPAGRGEGGCLVLCA